MDAERQAAILEALRWIQLEAADAMGVEEAGIKDDKLQRIYDRCSAALGPRNGR